MASVQYRLGNETEPRVRVDLVGNCDEVTVNLDGRPQATLRRHELMQGRQFPLADESVLEVRLEGQGLHVSRNGERLLGSYCAAESVRREVDPQIDEHLAAATGAIALVAFMNVTFGLLALVFDIEILKDLGMGIGTVLFGLFFGALAFLVRKGFGLAALVALGLFGLDAVLTLAMCAKAGAPPPVAGLIFRCYLLFQMSRGLAAFSAPRTA